MFARIYETEEHGQILVMRGTDESGVEDGPCIRIFFEAPSGGLVTITCSDSGLPINTEAVTNLLETLEEKDVTALVASVKNEMKGFFDFKP
jgi:hypothetical protein